MAPTIPPPPTLPQGHWLADFDQALVRTLISRRTLELALGSELSYARPPQLVDGIAVVATLGESLVADDPMARANAFRVELYVDEGGTALTGGCSRCAQSFGACTHVATVAVDLACSQRMREALLAGASTAEAAQRAPTLRFVAHTELRFDAA